MFRAVDLQARCYFHRSCAKKAKVNHYRQFFKVIPISLRRKQRIQSPKISQKRIQPPFLLMVIEKQKTVHQDFY